MVNNVLLEPKLLASGHTSLSLPRSCHHCPASLLVFSSIPHLGHESWDQSAEWDKAECAGGAQRRREVVLTWPSEWALGLGHGKEVAAEGGGRDKGRGLSSTSAAPTHPHPSTHSACSATRTAASRCSALRPMARRTCYSKMPPLSWCPLPHRPTRHGWALSTCMP